MDDVSRPLLGADFLRSKSLLVDLKGKRLVDTETFQSVPLGKSEVDAPHLNAISSSTNQYNRLLAKFPDITVPNFTQPTTKHGVEHFITTQYMDMPAACPLTNSIYPKQNSTGSKKWDSSAAHEHPRYTQYLKSQEVGDRVGITGASTMLWFSIATKYPISIIFQPTWQGNMSSQRSISCTATTRYQSLHQTY